MANEPRPRTAFHETDTVGNRPGVKPPDRTVEGVVDPVNSAVCHFTLALSKRREPPAGRKEVKETNQRLSCRDTVELPEGGMED